MLVTHLAFPRACISELYFIEGAGLSFGMSPCALR
jgi:hypothetical protein